MHFVLMNEEYFRNYADNHMYANMYQTIQYANLMRSTGFTIEYVGIIDEYQTILAAAMVMKQTLYKAHKYAYIPGGMLIDYSDDTILSFMINSLKKHLDKDKVAFLRIDPMVTMYEHALNGAVNGNINNSFMVDTLIKQGFQHFGFNKYFETSKPRWIALIDDIQDAADLPQNTNDVVNYRVNRAIQKGINVYHGNSEYLTDFYDIIKDKNRRRNLNFYQNYQTIFGKEGMFDTYFAILDPNSYSNTARMLYEMELGNNNDLTSRLENAIPEQREELLNLKMESDKKIVIYKNDINNSITLLQLYPKGLKVAAVATVKYNDTIYILIDGVLDKFRQFYPKHLLYAKIIEEYTKQGFKKINLNGVTGAFDPQDKLYRLHEFKGGFASKIIEYPGEFDLVLNQLAYFKLSGMPEFQTLIKRQTR